MTNHEIKSGLIALRTQIDDIRIDSDENADHLNRIALEARDLIEQVIVPASLEMEMERTIALKSLSMGFEVIGRYLYQEKYKNINTFMDALNFIDGAIDIFLYKVLEKLH